MLDKFKAYLFDLKLPNTVTERIDEVLKLNANIKTSEILDIFICDLKNKDGSRTYTSLWLFTERYCIECHNFLTEDNFDFTPYYKRIAYCNTTSHEFDFQNATENSFVNIHFALPNSILGDLITTGLNCEKAVKIYQNYIVQNLIE